MLITVMVVAALGGAIGYCVQRYRRVRQPELGRMSSQWIAEHRSSTLQP